MDSGEIAGSKIFGLTMGLCLLLVSELDHYIDKAFENIRANRYRSGDQTICEGIHLIVGEITEEMHGKGKSSISHLVHYTGTDVLFAILEKADDKAGLRLYDTVHANDPEEGRFLLRYWKNEPEKWPWMWDEGEIGDSGRNKALGFKELVEQDLYPGHAYVVSFVPTVGGGNNNDRLVFWKEYGREGAGCSLSISENKLFNGRKCSLTPYRVRYGRNAVTELRSKLNERLFKPIERRIQNAEGPEKMLFTEAQVKIRDELQLFRYLYKDSAYEHEKEYRMVIVGARTERGKKLTYEQQTNSFGQTVFRHYMTHKSLCRKQIFGLQSEVILGPTVSHAKNVLSTIEGLLHRRHISGTKVTFSEINYRGR